MAWTFVLTTLDGTNIGGVLNADDRGVSLALNGPQTAKFTIGLDNPLASAITDLKGDVRLKVYQGSTLRFNGELTSAEESGVGYRRVFTRDTLVNLGYSLGDTVRVGLDLDSQAARGLFEEVVPSDFADAGLRQAFVNEFTRVRSIPRETITLEALSDQEPTLACNFAGPLWRLQKRLCGQATDGITFASTDRAQIVKQLIDTANAIADTGIRTTGTIDTLYPAGAGPWIYKPIAEAIVEMANTGAFFVETASGALALDNFNGMTVGASLIGRPASAGGIWAVDGGGGGDTHPFVGYVGTAIARTAVSDISIHAGRWAVLGSVPTHEYTNVLVQADVSYPGAYGAVKSGVVARYTDTNNHIMATLDALSPVSKLSVMKETTADSVVTLGTSEEYSLNSGALYTMRLQINTAGQWALWFWPTGDPVPSAPVLFGQHDDLSSTGSLATGRVGLYDVNATATAITRIYDEFKADTLTQPMDLQGLDFNIVPTEPTPDGLGIQHATISIEEAVGTSKPNVIFESGPEVRPDNRPEFGDYDVGDTITARASYNGTVRFNGTARVQGVDIGINKEGKEDHLPDLTPDS